MKTMAENQFETVSIKDDMGKESIMIRIPKFKVSDVVEGGADIIHPAFVVDGIEKDAIFVSKHRNVVDGGRGYSLENSTPSGCIDFDTAKQLCESKGNGWHLMTNAEWSALALLSVNLGKELIERYFWEWVGGLRIVDGEIQVIPNNDAAKQIDQSSNSDKWRAVLGNGSYALPGSIGTLKFDSEDDNNTLVMDTEISNRTEGFDYFESRFAELGARENVEVPELLKMLAIYPYEHLKYRKEWIFARNTGERLPDRGGGWFNGSYAGVFCLGLSDPRSGSYTYLGFRSAYVI